MISGMTDDITALDETAQKTDEPYKEAKNPPKGKKTTTSITKIVNGVTYKKGADGLWHKQ
jgi:N-acyl-D-aspartate/D-glutamate deacylase